MPLADPLGQKRWPNETQSFEPGVRGDRELPERATPGMIGHFPEESRESNPRLNQAAETVGRALGTAVSGVRGIPEKLNDTKQRFTVIRGGAGEGAKAKVNEAVEQAKQKGEELVDKAREKGEELVEQARTKGEELKEQAQIRFEQARARVEHVARHDPFRVIGVAAVCGVILGIVLRVWRDHYAG